MALTLTSCATFGNKTVSPVYPVIPADLQICFDQIVPAPKAGPTSKGEAMKLIASLKKSETEKTECGHRLLDFYEDLSHPQ